MESRDRERAQQQSQDQNKASSKHHINSISSRVRGKRVEGGGKRDGYESEPGSSTKEVTSSDAMGTPIEWWKR